MCPLYIAGLLGPGDRKSIEPMATRLAPGQYDRIHHFISDGMWDDEPLRLELAHQADRMVGADDAFLVIDETPLTAFRLEFTFNANARLMARILCVRIRDWSFMSS